MTDPTPLAPFRVAPARVPQATIRRQARLFAEHPMLVSLLDASPVLYAVLNDRNQFVFVNRAIQQFLALPDRESLYGKRLGEAFGCPHAPGLPNGCGTTSSCEFCGAARAFRASRERRAETHEYHLTRAGGAVDMRVWTTPLEIAGESFLIYAMTDVSHENRRRALERVFFHDVLNTVSVLYGTAEIVESTDGRQRAELLATMRRLAMRLSEEIVAQQFLLAAENRELTPEGHSIRSLELIKERASVYALIPLAQGHPIVLRPDSRDVELVSDRALLDRVVDNMLKNALEAAPKGGAVTLGCSADDREVEFTVHNPGHMPADVQAQVFQRSFSTKGIGRGLGTYGMKLLTESYLGGTVGFTSTQEAGTTFRCRYPLKRG
ncbi:MAG: PAS domain-containing protein [Elusimicrobia bacterium]|nr:PAS domain-containing protein [Elusimicrobiota bacterium]